MNLINRLKRLEQVIAINADRVYFVNQDTKGNSMKIPALDFQGTIDEGRELIGRYPNSVFIIDDIPRSCTEGVC